LLHADGQTGMKKLIVSFCNFANAHKTLGWEKRRAPLKPVQHNIRHFKREGTKLIIKDCHEGPFPLEV